MQKTFSFPLCFFLHLTAILPSPMAHVPWLREKAPSQVAMAVVCFSEGMLLICTSEWLARRGNHFEGNAPPLSLPMAHA